MGRRLGQHFLTDPRILDRIVAALDPRPDDVVIEIGAGKGSLTRRLAPTVGRVIAIERDRELVEALQGVGRGQEDAPRAAAVTVIEGDALELDWHALVPLRPSGDAVPSHFSLLTPHLTYKVIGNIPYYITGPLIEKALTPPLPAVVVFLVQREVAERLAAGPGSKTYGALTVGVQARARVERLFTVPAGAFRPRPAVDSAVVRLVPRERPLVPVERHSAFRRFLAQVFGQRRKQLGRVVRSLAEGDRDRAEALLAQRGIDPMQRAEVLAPEELVELFRALDR